MGEKQARVPVLLKGPENMDNAPAPLTTALIDEAGEPLCDVFDVLRRLGDEVLVRRWRLVDVTAWGIEEAQDEAARLSQTGERIPGLRLWNMAARLHQWPQGRLEGTAEDSDAVELTLRLSLSAVEIVAHSAALRERLEQRLSGSD